MQHQKSPVLGLSKSSDHSLAPEGKDCGYYLFSSDVERNGRRMIYTLSQTRGIMTVKVCARRCRALLEGFHARSNVFDQLELSLLLCRMIFDIKNKWRAQSCVEKSDIFMMELVRRCTR